MRLVSIFCACACLVGCTEAEIDTGEYTRPPTLGFLDMQMEQLGENVLLWTISAETEEPGAAQVTFSYEGGPLRKTGFSEPGTSHEWILVGLRAEEPHNVTLSGMSEGGVTWPEHSGTFTTGELPEEIAAVSVNAVADANLEPGFTAFGPGVEQIYGFAVDDEGEVVWYHTDPEIRSSMLARQYKELPGGDLFSMTQTGYEIMSPAGDVSLQYPAQGDTGRPIHHDAILLPSGNVLALSNETQTLTVPELGGEVKVLGDVLLELSPSGEELWRWSTFEHLDTQRFPTELSKNESRSGAGFDWTHANGLFYVAADDSILVSLRSQQWIIKISRDDGQVLWRLGHEGDFELLEGQWFSAQHAPELHEDGLLLLYDNGNERETEGSPFSRAVGFSLDESARTARQVFSFETEHFTGKLGGARRLNNGNVLVCAGGVNRSDQAIISEVEFGTGKELWSLRLGKPGLNVYRAERLSESWPYGQDVQGEENE